ncbi:transposase, MuDR, MULE transposase domain protein [Tanacetum coccineum]
MNYLRPLVIIDGAHLKDDVYHGVNLLDIGMDGNNQTLPIAFGICQGEDGAGWTWFLEELKACISQKPNLSIISDRHPAILESVKKVFPNAFHGFCCRHLMMNAAIKKERHKAVYWEACKAYTTEAFDECMDYIQSVWLLMSVWIIFRVQTLLLRNMRRVIKGLHSYQRIKSGPIVYQRPQDTNDWIAHRE